MINEELVLTKFEAILSEKIQNDKDKVDREKVKKLIKDIESLNVPDNKDVQGIVDSLKKLLKEGLTLVEYDDRYEFSKTGKYHDPETSEKIKHHTEKIYHHITQLKTLHPKLHAALSNIMKDAKRGAAYGSIMGASAGLRGSKGENMGLHTLAGTAGGVVGGALGGALGSAGKEIYKAVRSK